MDNFIARARAVLTSVVTWLVIIAATLTAAAAPIAAELGVDHPSVVWIAKIVTAVWLIIAIVRNVTRALPEARGLLQPADPTIPYTTREENLQFDLARVTEQLERERTLRP